MTSARFLAMATAISIGLATEAAITSAARDDQGVESV